MEVMQTTADKDVPMKEEAAAFIAVLLHSGTIAHFQHLQTDSYAKHKALAKYYESIIGLVDDFAEAYQGEYGVIADYPADFHIEKDAVKYLDNIAEFIKQSREELPQDKPLQTLIDNIAVLVDSTRYKLKSLS